jgi:hypothetical protein
MAPRAPFVGIRAPPRRATDHFKETPMSLRFPVPRSPVVAGVALAATDLAATVVAAYVLRG